MTLGMIFTLVYLAGIPLSFVFMLWGMNQDCPQDEPSDNWMFAGLGMFFWPVIAAVILVAGIATMGQHLSRNGSHA